MKICILIPAYNEAKSVGRLVREIRAKSLDVLVVDDGSRDATSQVARDAGAMVLTNSQNQGKGFSLQRGFDHISGHDYDALITMDGDGQHAVEDIDSFIALFQKDHSDIICGNRMADHRGMPLVRLLTNRVMSWLISLVCRQKVCDSQCGYRLIRTEVLRNTHLSSSAFEIESEVLIKAARKGFRIASVPIRTIYSGQRSHINPVFDTVRFVVYIVREIFVR